MKLSLKATRFVIEALQHYRQCLAQRVDVATLSEDEIADLTNDGEYIDAIRSDFEKYRDELSQNPHAAV